MKTKSPLLISWKDFERVTGSVAQQLSAIPLPFDHMVAIGRGGLMPAVLLSHALGIARISVLAMRITENDAAFSNKRAAPEILEKPSTFGKRVLLVDDIVGTGKTMTAAHDLILQAGTSCVRPACLWLNASNYKGQLPQDWVVGETITTWAIFPWEAPLLNQRSL